MRFFVNNGPGPEALLQYQLDDQELELLYKPEAAFLGSIPYDKT